MALCVVQYKALVLIILIIGASIGASAEECQCEENNGIPFGKIAGCGALAVGAVVAAPYALSAAGFTTSGIAAGSVASWTHAYIGKVAAGSWFSVLQSMGATGFGVKFGAGTMFSSITSCFKLLQLFAGASSSCNCCPKPRRDCPKQNRWWKE